MQINLKKTFQKSASFTFALFLFIFFFYSDVYSKPSTTVTFWHSFRGREAKALEYIKETFALLKPDIIVKLKSFSADNFSFVTEIENVMCTTDAPDIFIWANDKTGEWADDKKILPVSEYLNFTAFSNYLTNAVSGLEFNKKIYGLPLSIECLALFYNKNKIAVPPKTMDELIKLSLEFKKKNSDYTGLVYPINDVYYHALWLHAFGGRLLNNSHQISLNTVPMKKSLEYAHYLKNKLHIIPEYDIGVNWWDYTLEYFKNQRAVFMFSGPWILGSLAGENFWDIAPLPSIDSEKNLQPFLGVKALFLTTRERTSEHLQACLETMQYFASSSAGVILGNIGGYIPANINAYNNESLNANKHAVAFRNQAINSLPMPNHKNMSYIWQLNTIFDEELIFKQIKLNIGMLTEFLANAELKLRR